MTEPWPRDAYRRDRLVAERRRDRQVYASIVPCGCCGASGPWTSVDAVTAWIVCASCQADLARYSRSLDRLAALG